MNSSTNSTSGRWRAGPPRNERALAAKFIAGYGDKRADAAQDLMWALLNSRDFTMLQ